MVPPAGDARLGDQADRLYELYERKARAFRTALISVMSLITIILALVFYPYVTFRGERYTLEAEAVKLRGSLDLAQRRLAESNELLEEYRELMPAASARISEARPDTLSPAAAEHNRALSGIRRATAGDPAVAEWLAGAEVGEEPPSDLRRRHAELHQGRGKPCFWLSGDAWRRCALKQALDSAHGDAARRFQRGHISQLRNELFGPLSDALRSIEESFATYLLGDQSTWRVNLASITERLPEWHQEFLRRAEQDWTGRLAVSGTLTEQSEVFARLYRYLLEVHERFLYQTREQLGNEMRDIAREEARIEGELDVIVSKLEELKGLQDIETPFGTLPVGINELVLLFPVLVAAGYMLMASLFVESLELRQEYRLLTRLIDSDGTVLPDRRVALIAPLWIDPLKPLSHRAYRAAILGLPLLAFVGAIWLLVRNQLLTGPFIKEARLNAVIYYGLYIAGALTILEGSRRIVQALRRHPVEGQPEAARRDTEPDHD